MRYGLLGVLALTIACLVAPAEAAPKRKPVDPAAAATAASVDQTIKEVFDRANSNHNDVLSKTEFRKAQGMLESAAMDLARNGVIGKTPTSRSGKKTSSNLTAPAAGALDLSKNNKITLSEFTLYAQSYLQNADTTLVQARAAYDARQKARNSRYRPRNGQR